MKIVFFVSTFFLVTISNAQRSELSLTEGNLVGKWRHVWDWGSSTVTLDWDGTGSYFAESTKVEFTWFSEEFNWKIENGFFYKRTISYSTYKDGKSERNIVNGKYENLKISLYKLREDNFNRLDFLTGSSLIKVKH